MSYHSLLYARDPLVASDVVDTCTVVLVTIDPIVLVIVDGSYILDQQLPPRPLDATYQAGLGHINSGGLCDGYRRSCPNDQRAALGG